MTFNLFAKKIQTALHSYFGDDMIMDLQRITKNNGIELTGMIIREEDSDVATTIYLDSFYAEYEDGRTMSETVCQIIKLYEEHKMHQNTDMSFFNEYSQLKHRLACRLINGEKNRGLLARVPHRTLENLAIVCHCIMISDEFGCASVVVDYSHLHFWKIT